MLERTNVEMNDAKTEGFYNERTLQRTNAKTSNATTNYDTTNEVITKENYNEQFLSVK